MPDASLHGNHAPCQDCNGQGKVPSDHPMHPNPLRCTACKGRGFKGLTRSQIIKNTTTESRKSYWPQFEQRIAQHKGIT